MWCVVGWCVVCGGVVCGGCSGVEVQKGNDMVESSDDKCQVLVT